MGRRLGMTWFDLMQLHVTGSLNVGDGGNGSEKLFSKIMIAEMKGGGAFVLFLLNLGIQRQKNTSNIILSVIRP
jgi:hypothetical protein